MKKSAELGIFKLQRSSGSGALETEKQGSIFDRAVLFETKVRAAPCDPAESFQAQVLLGHVVMWREKSDA